MRVVPTLLLNEITSQGLPMVVLSIFLSERSNSFDLKGSFCTHLSSTELYSRVVHRCLKGAWGCSCRSSVPGLKDIEAISFFSFLSLRITVFLMRRSILVLEMGSAPILWVLQNPLCSLDCFLKHIKAVNAGQKFRTGLFYCQTDEGTEPVSREPSSTLQLWQDN